MSIEDNLMAGDGKDFGAKIEGEDKYVWKDAQVKKYACQEQQLTGNVSHSERSFYGSKNMWCKRVSEWIATVASAAVAARKRVHFAAREWENVCSLSHPPIRMQWEEISLVTAHIHTETVT
jgi:hypothetical protein